MENSSWENEYLAIKFANAFFLLSKFEGNRTISFHKGRKRCFGRSHLELLKNLTIQIISKFLVQFDSQL